MPGNMVQFAALCNRSWTGHCHFHTPFTDFASSRQHNRLKQDSKGPQRPRQFFPRTANSFHTKIQQSCVYTNLNSRSDCIMCCINSEVFRAESRQFKTQVRKVQKRKKKPPFAALLKQTTQLRALKKKFSPREFNKATQVQDKFRKDLHSGQQTHKPQVPNFKEILVAPSWFTSLPVWVS